MPGIIAFIQALPELLRLMNRMGDVFERILMWSEKVGLDAWIDDLEKRIDELEKAETPKQKLDAAQSLVGSIRKLK